MGCIICYCKWLQVNNVSKFSFICLHQQKILASWTNTPIGEIVKRHTAVICIFNMFLFFSVQTGKKESNEFKYHIKHRNVFVLINIFLDILYNSQTTEKSLPLTCLYQLCQEDSNLPECSLDITGFSTFSLECECYK